MGNLNKKLAEELVNSSKGLPEWFKNYVVKKFIKNGQESSPLQVGDKVPDGIFLNHKNQQVELSTLLQGKSAIISFYRGAWCPYCNLELRHYDSAIKNSESDILMLGISPEKPDVTTETIEIEKLHFIVLSDLDNKFAEKLGLVYKLKTFIKLFTKAKGGNLKRSQGNHGDRLPIPATYIIDSERVIRHAWLDADFTKRAEPDEVIKAYIKLKNKDIKATEFKTSLSSQATS